MPALRRPLTCRFRSPELRQLALRFPDATVDSVGVRQNKLVRRERAGIDPVGRPAKRRLATGVLRHYCCDRRDSRRQGECPPAGEERCGCLPVSTFAASIAGLGLQPDAVYDSRDSSAEAGHRSPDWPDHFESSELSSCRTLRCSPSDQRKVIAERRRTSCMTRKIVTPARDQ